jgi:hypothetical protein
MVKKQTGYLDFSIGELQQRSKHYLKQDWVADKLIQSPTPDKLETDARKLKPLALSL